MRMMRTAISLCFVAACGGDDGGGATPDAGIDQACQEWGGAACFQLPTAPMTNSDGAPSAQSCPPNTPRTSTPTMSYSGNVGFFGTNNVIAGAQVDAYTSVAYTSPIASATSAVDGTYTLTIPAGSPDVLWVSAGGPGALTTYNHGYHARLFDGDITDFNLRLFTPGNIEGATGLVGGTWDESKAVLAAYVLACDARVVTHAAVVISSTAGTRTFVDGVQLYYAAPGAVPLAVPPTDRADTNDNGIVAVLGLPPGDSLHVQVWGFRDEAALARGADGLSLIADHPLHIAAGSVLAGDLHPNQSPD
jgi:hypothetical protein